MNGISGNDHSSNREGWKSAIRQCVQSPLTSPFMAVSAPKSSKIQTVDSAQLRQMLRLREEYRARRLIRRQRQANNFILYWLAKLFRYETYLNALRAALLQKDKLSIFLGFDLIIDICVVVLSVVEIEVAFSPFEEKWYWISRPFWLWLAFVVTSIYNIFALLTRLVFSRNWRYALFSWPTLIDFITAVPAVISLTFPMGQYLLIPFFLRIWTVVRRLRHFLDLEVEQSRNGAPADALTIQLWVLVATVIGFIMTGMCLFQYTEMAFANVRLNAIQSLYFAVITSATVGYGDIVPHTAISQFIVIIMIVTTFAYFPMIINNIIETYRSRKEGHHSYVAGKRPFVVICLSYSNDQFLLDVAKAALYSMTRKQRFVKRKISRKEGDNWIGSSDGVNNGEHNPSNQVSEDRINQMPHETLLLSSSYHIVFLSLKSPSGYSRTILKSPRYASRFTFIEGSPLEEADLRRCVVRKASACFVLADRGKCSTLDGSVFEEDHENVLRVWSVRKYAPNTPVYVYNLRPETDAHVRPLARQVVCVNSIKQLILGYSCLHKGSAALITNLIHQAPRLSKYRKAWQIVYADGIQNGIHFGPFNSLFEGKIFSQLAWYLYAEFQAIIIGLRFRVPLAVDEDFTAEETPHYTFKDHTILNPGPNYVIPSGDIVKEMVFISQSMEDLADIESLTGTQFEETWSKWIVDDSSEIVPSRVELEPVTISNMFHPPLQPPSQLPTDSVQSDWLHNGGCKCFELAEHVSESSHELDPVNLAAPFFSDASVKTKMPITTEHGTRNPQADKQRKGKTLDTLLEEDGDVEEYERPSLIPGFSKQTTLPANPNRTFLFVGHPAPPHHLVLDQDLQSPFCHLSRTPMKISDAKIADCTVGEEALGLNAHHKRSRGISNKGRLMKLSDHILICSSNFELWTFLCTLRASFVPQSKLKPVLIMCSSLPTLEEWRSISMFPFVYYIQGSPLKRSDLKRAGIFAASCVIIMKQQALSSVSLSEERYIDGPAIMATHQIDFIVRDRYIITELMTRNNIKFMRAKHEMLDSALYVASDNPQLPRIQSIAGYKPTFVSKDYNQTETSIQPAHQQTQYYSQKSHGNESYSRHSNQENINTEDPGYYAHSAIFASGRVLAGDMYDGLVFEAFRTPGIVDVVKLLCGRRYHQWKEINSHLQLKSSVLLSIDLPAQLVGQTFSTLFKHFALIHGIVPVAIYRQKTLYSDSEAGAPQQNKENTFSFANISLDRSATVVSVASINSYAPQHMSNLEMDRDKWNNTAAATAEGAAGGDPGKIGSYAQQFYRMADQQQATMRSQTALDMSRLLEETNRVDNELPFVITNPLPDFVLDSKDMVFVLHPTA